MVLGVLVYQSTIPSSEVEVPREEQAGAILNGMRPSLPAKDHFNRPTPKGSWVGRVLIGRGCSDCSLEDHPLLALEDGPQPVVYFVGNTSILNDIDFSKSSKNVFVIVDEEKSILPRAAYRVAPFLFNVDDAGIVTGIEAKLDPSSRGK